MPTNAHEFWVGMGTILLFMGGHGCDIIGNIIGNVTISEYMGAIWTQGVHYSLKPKITCMHAPY